MINECAVNEVAVNEVAVNEPPMRTFLNVNIGVLLSEIVIELGSQLLRGDIAVVSFNSQILRGDIDVVSFDSQVLRGDIEIISPVNGTVIDVTKGERIIF